MYEPQTDELELVWPYDTPTPQTGVIGVDIDDVIAWMEGRRHRSGAVRRPAGRSGKTSDSAPRRPKYRIDLVLYTSGASEKCLRALRSVRDVLERYDDAQIKFTVCDLLAAPQRGDADAVIFTPTLVKRGPGPRTWIVGDLSQPDLLIDLLDASGVDRRNDSKPRRRPF